mmetsp:Transcript_30191/g.42073  ORF Transcript_30191/g.42073 Transcript_30191/m.42073 type:complete len:178 (+) Transcript_30191:97-630(+)|eukprot:CAMPEP_0185251236 /NCGR_PEP_ID=MMETSP1359-20130426/666_1 /TAXON_ID=552665 /ORGANISM="Bigelowiella longifila, Strain CCMP242" /LENGTH=177 /DNA_ID=CAMNT_0027833045 /DNA_START=78 /DNA_END=611 /DNA_ORIENTATION=+
MAASKEKTFLEDIQSKDTEDKSLNNYKEKLLGKVGTPFPDDPRKVIVKEFYIQFEDGTKITMDPTDKKLIEKLKKEPIEIKEKALYKFGVGFYIQHDICHGLKLKIKVGKMGFSNTDDYSLGSYGPKEEIQTWFQKSWEEAPSGMLSRGGYSGSGTFYDLDKNKHLEWNFKLSIVKA